MLLVKQRSPANFSQQGRPLAGPYSAQAAQAKQMSKMQKGTKKAINQVIKQGDSGYYWCSESKDL